MATQNNRKLLGKGFRFYEPKPKLNSNIKLHRRNSHTTHKKLKKSRTRATYNSMFYGY
ncbi:MAG: hypothetical protein GOP50_03085 [Candidatus Heimdallarchaeota archaeon]|nr:hypothetical protein [Candidatus Heimdallarchaeota archaeon]